MIHRAHRSPRLLAALLLLAGGGRAAADGLSLRAEPVYSGSETTVTDETGRTTRTDQTAIEQRYRLTLDRQLYPNLRFSGGGLYDWTLGSGTTQLGRSEVDARKWSGFGRLALTGDLLAGGAFYDRREEATDVRTAGLALSAPSLVRESWSVAADWRPEGLPAVNLRLGRAHTFDRSGQVADLTQDEAVAGLTHRTRSRVELQYLGRWAHPVDAVAGVERQELTQTGRVSWGRGFAGDRGSFHAGYTLQHRLASTVATGRGGEVATQQFPSSGLSIVEPLAGLPERVTLNPNPALVDGDLAASAGIDLGTSAPAGKRDLGVGFPNAQTEVNGVRVWVQAQAPIPRDVAARLPWAAYRSDDNVTWTEVVPQSVSFEPFDGHFDVRLPPTRARYVKVVTSPLPVAVTLDPRFATILVTEVQVFENQPVEAVRGTSTFTTGNFNGSGRFLILRDPSLAYDVAVLAGHDPARTTYTVVNGISAAHRPNRVIGLSARADRTDSSDEIEHVGQFRLTGTVSADPLQELGAALTYSGQATDQRSGWSILNAVTLVTRLEPYRGVTLASNATVSLLQPSTGGETQTRILGASLSLAPHRKVAVTGSYAYTLNDVRGVAAGAGRTQLQRVEGTLSLTPISALFGTVSVSRVFAGTGDSTLTNFAANFSPFQGGDLLLRMQYSETLDTGAQQETRLAGPSLRWNVRRATYFDVAYTFNETTSPVLDTRSRAVFASFVATID